MKKNTFLFVVFHNKDKQKSAGSFLVKLIFLSFAPSEVKHLRTNMLAQKLSTVITAVIESLCVSDVILGWSSLNYSYILFLFLTTTTIANAS